MRCVSDVWKRVCSYLMLDSSPLTRYYSESIPTRVLDRSSIRMLYDLGSFSGLGCTSLDCIFLIVLLYSSLRLVPSSFRSAVIA